MPSHDDPTAGIRRARGFGRLRGPRPSSVQAPVELFLIREETAEARHALADAVLRWMTEGEAHLVRAATVRIEGGPGHVRDPTLDRGGEHRPGVDPVGEGHPDVEAAGRPGPGRAPRERLPERLEHHV